jgi:hypothetical protein
MTCDRDDAFMIVAYELRATVRALERVGERPEPPGDLSAAADRAWRALIGADWAGGEPALAHIERLQALVGESLRLAAARCREIADAMARVEEVCEADSGRLTLSARRAAQIERRLSNEARQWQELRRAR